MLDNSGEWQNLDEVKSFLIFHIELALLFHYILSFLSALPLSENEVEAWYK